MAKSVMPLMNGKHERLDEIASLVMIPSNDFLANCDRF